MCCTAAGQNLSLTPYIMMLCLLCWHCGVLLLLHRSRNLAVVTYAAADGSSSGEVQQISAAAGLGPTAAISGSSVAVLSEDRQQLCVLPSPGEQGWLQSQQNWRLLCLWI